MQAALEQAGLDLRGGGQRQQRRHLVVEQLEAVVDGGAALAPDHVELRLAVLAPAGEAERQSADQPLAVLAAAAALRDQRRAGARHALGLEVLDPQPARAELPRYLAAGQSVAVQGGDPTLALIEAGQHGVGQLDLFALPLELDQLDVGALARRRELALDRAPVDEHLVTMVGALEQAPDPPQRGSLQPVVDLALATAATLARRGGKQADVLQRVLDQPSRGATDPGDLVAEPLAAPVAQQPGEQLVWRLLAGPWRCAVASHYP